MELGNMNYLALGDSYTYGEQVCILENFPYQLVKMIREKGYNLHAPELIAKTAWTSSELKEAIKAYPIGPDFDLCSLLIGVNNQYRKLDIHIFEEDIDWLCEFSLSRIQQNPAKLVLLNIPDWGLTPFNKERDPASVSKEIDDYNAIIKEKSQEIGCHFVDICTSTREHAKDVKYLAGDQLHYSGKEYSIWSKKILTDCLNLS